MDSERFQLVIDDNPSWATGFQQLDETEQRDLAFLARPHITIDTHPVPPGELQLGQSHFGGRPHLPAGFSWPTSEYGLLRFLAQINLADIHDLITRMGLALPSDGWLLAFASGAVEHQPGLVTRDSEGNFQPVPDLVHLSYIAPGTPIHDAEDQWDGWDQLFPEWVIADPLKQEEHRTASRTLSFGEGLSLPDDLDARQLLPDSAKDESMYWNDWSINGAGHKLMGWATSFRSGGTCPGADWRNVLTLACDDDLLWNWCDGSQLNIHAHIDGLTQRTFSPCEGDAC